MRVGIEAGLGLDARILPPAETGECKQHQEKRRGHRDEKESQTPGFEVLERDRQILVHGIERANGTAAQRQAQCNPEISKNVVKTVGEQALAPLEQLGNVVHGDRAKSRNASRDQDLREEELFEILGQY